MIAPRFIDPRIWTFIPNLRPADADAVAQRFRRWSSPVPADMPDAKSFENWLGIDRATGTPVGHFQATIFRDGSAMIGYVVFFDSQGRGFAVEAMGAVVKHLRDDHAIGTIVAEMHSENAASIAVAARLGLRETAREYAANDRVGSHGWELRYEWRAPADDLTFAVVRANAPEATALIAALDADLEMRYPGGEINGIDADEFEAGGGIFAVASVAGEPAACGALRPFGRDIEVKRMFVRPRHRGRGIARRMLAFLEERARAAGFARAILETGNAQPEAIALYEACGWSRIAPFGKYIGDPRSVCFAKALI